MKPPRQTARAVLSRYLNQPIGEENRFDGSRTRLAIYFAKGFYWSAPPVSERPVTGWEWTHMGDHEGRPIFRATMPPERLWYTKSGVLQVTLPG
jgi:hypothetical protein